MKKLKLIAIILFVMLSSVIFSACNDNYKRLNMSFYLNNEKVSAITLFIDDSKNDSKNLSVEFNGISAESIGEVVVDCNQSGIVQVGKGVLDGNKYNFTITANNPTAGAKLTVTHLASNKSESIDLVVERKSSGINVVKNTYIISVPQAGEAKKVSNIKAEDILNLSPIDSTDNVYFKLEGVLKTANIQQINNYLTMHFSGITVGNNQYVEIAGCTYITGFTTTNLATNKSLRVIPVTYMQGYEVEEFNENPITIKFAKTLNDDQLILSSNDYGFNWSLQNNKTITLLYNDDVNASFVNVNINTIEGNLNQFVASGLYLNDFEYVIGENTAFDQTLFSVIPQGDFGYRINANKYTSKTIQIKFTLLPNPDYAGELKRISVVVNVQGRTRPNGITVLQDGKEPSYTLYNYYQNGYGSKFNFGLTPIDVIDDFKTMRLVVDSKFLDTNFEAGALGNVYEDNTFTKQITDKGFFDNSDISTNNNLLTIYINTRKLKFYFEDGKFYSEPFYENNSLYMMYKSQAGSSTDAMQLKVQAYYSGKQDYLKNTVPTEKLITFNNQEGVRDFDVELGYWDGGDFKYFENRKISYKDFVQNNIDTLYFNKNDINKNYGFVLNNVANSMGDISLNLDTNFNIEILGGGNNPIKLYEDLISNNELFENPYNYIANSLPKKLTFGVDSLTDEGEYVLRITHNNGLVMDIKLVVYASIKESDIKNSLVLNGNYITNNVNSSYYQQYSQADYIVAVGEVLTANTNIFDKYNKDYVLGIVYNTPFASLEELDAERCLAVTQNGVNAKLEFLAGSYYQNNNQYIKLTVDVLTQKYEDIFKLADEKEKTSLTISFFIYESLSNNSLFINKINTRYTTETLALSLKENAVATLSLSSKNNELLNYVQKQTQMVNGGFGVNGSYNVVWDITSAVGGEIETLNQNDNDLQIQFNNLFEDASSFTYTIRATINQFNKKYYKFVTINVKNAILTEQLILDGLAYTDNTGSHLNTLLTADGIGDYINVEAGQTYTLLANNYPSNITNAGVAVYLSYYDNNNYKLTTYYRNGLVRVDGNNIAINKVDVDESFGNLKVVAFALNNLMYDPLSEQYPTIDGFTDILINGLRSSFVAFDLVVSTGQKDNPYLITSSKDLYKLNNTNNNVWFKIMNDINIADVDFVIENCNANIVTLNDNQYTFYGIALDEARPNLFSNFGGEMNNVTFEVDYSYSSAFANGTKLGVFDKNNGKLRNVAVKFNGVNVNLIGNINTVQFGGLVGENAGLIEYDKHIVGAQGNLTLGGGAEVYFGGLVGLNSGKILGYIKSTDIDDNNQDLEIVFGGSTTTGVTSNVNIVSNLTNNDSAVGGLVGLNNSTFNEAIKNVNVTGSIEGKDNIGGIVGKNIYDATALVFNIDYSGSGQKLDLLSYINETYNLVNSTSSAIIIGRNNIGGVVGLDVNGRYKNSRYLIYSFQNSALKGENNVGGIAGQSTDGLFEYCSVMSYRWDYSRIRLNTYDGMFEGIADILGNSAVGGIVGLANSTEFIEISIGNANYNAATIINASSVNAYVKCKTDVGSLGGIITINSRLAVMYNTYFIGKLDGFVNNLFELANNNNVYYNNSYVVYLDRDDALTEADLSSADLDISNAHNTHPIDDTDVWDYNSSLNGGYIYLRYDNKPLFDIAPTSLVANLDWGVDENGDVVVKYIDDKIAYKLGNTSLLLEYYSFELNQTNINSSTLLSNLNKKYNTFDILDLVTFSVEPSALKKLNLLATSTNKNVVEVSNGKILVRGVGNASIVFTSALNGNVSTKIDVKVMYPMGNKFSITAGATSIEQVSKLNIQLNKSAKLYLSYLGYKNLLGVDYSYYVNNGYKLLLKTNKDISNIATIQNAEFNSENTAIIDSNISLTAIKAGENFNLTIIPVLLDEQGNILVQDNLNAKTITINTFTGPSSVNFSQTSSVVYPDFNYSVSVFVSSDLDLTSQINNIVNWLIKSNFAYWSMLVNSEDEWVEIDFSSVAEIEYLSTSYMEDKKQQKINFSIRFKSKLDKAMQYMARFNLAINDNKVLSASTIYTLLPQQISSINLKNYVYRDNGIEQTNTIQPYKNGLIIIDMLPFTGYFDYLEIKDITGRQQIRFAQIDGIGGNRLNEFDTPTDDGLGIKLFKQNSGQTVYVSTAISSNYASITHTLQVQAFLSDGTPISDYFTIEVAVRLLPGVKVVYYAPNGDEKWTEESSTRDTEYLAVGTNANFKVTAINSNGGINNPVITLLDDNNSVVTNNYYGIDYIGNNFYRLNFIGNQNMLNSLLGKKLKISFTTNSILPNGDVEIGETIIILNFVNFVINDVSVTSSRLAGNNNEVYGNFGQTIPFEFYFKNTDISYYDNGSDEREYKLSTRKDDKSNNTLNAIYYILEQLNSGEESYLSWYTAKNEVYSTQQLKDNNLGVIYDLENHKITVTNGTEITAVSIQFNLTLNSDLNFEIESYDIDKDINMQNRYNLTFALANTEFEPELIRNEQEFLNMAMGAQSNYLLVNDLVLENYTPMTLDVETFDGNGRTITIKSFSTFTNPDLQAGLFSEITNTTLLMNLQVNYELTSATGVAEIRPPSYSQQIDDEQRGFVVRNYYHLGQDGITYQSAKAGGIAVTNNGMITNCKVVGTFAVETPALEQSDYVNFVIGGLAATNMGYITNCVSELRIASMANIGGLVYENTNSGKIVASTFDAKDNQGLIYSYYGNQSMATVKANSAGLAVINNGQILMSKVSVGYSQALTEENNANGPKIGNMSTKDESAGFIFNNNNVISDCYVDMDLFGSNSNVFNGFVANNNGQITNCYSYVNKGMATNSANLFAPTGTTNVNNCYIIIDNAELTNTTNGIKGLNAIYERDMFTMSSYSGFVFGDNQSAVWKIKTSRPELVAVDETTPFENYNDAVVTDNVTDYFGFKTVREELVVQEDGSLISKVDRDYSNYGSKKYPYIIYNENNWNKGFTQANRSYYFRLVSDINFAGKAPLSSTVNFQGNIQGNGMVVSNVLLNTRESLDSIGVFATMEADVNIVNAVRNINFANADISAVKTNAVGTLAGVVTGFNLYNINLNSNSTILGDSVVGGLAGIIRGTFDVEDVYSNVSVNSSYVESSVNYNVYLSVNNGKSPSYNLKSVSYAGSLFGIADGYIEGLIVGENRTNVNYNYIKNISIDSELTAVGDTVGSAIGLVGEAVYLKDVVVNLTGYKLGGYQYSGGVVGENRGVVDSVNITADEETIFNDSHTTTAGIVGLNLGGLVMNSTAHLDIIRTTTYGSSGIVAGIVGRNIAGAVYNCAYNGKLMIANSNAFEVTAGIVGAMYSIDIAKNQSSGLNKISNDTAEAIPDRAGIYKIDANTNSLSSNNGAITLCQTVQNSTVGNGAIAYWLNNLSAFYNYKNITDKNYEKSLSVYRVLGLAVGVVSEDINDNLNDNLHYGLDNQGNLVLNGNYYTNDVAKFDCAMYNGAQVITPYVNVASLDSLNSNLSEEEQVKIGNYVTYVIGHKLGAFDSWDKSNLNGEKLMFTNTTEGKSALQILAEIPADNGEYEYKSATDRLYIIEGKNIFYQLTEVYNDSNIYLSMDLSNYIGFMYSENSSDIKTEIDSSNFMKQIQDDGYEFTIYSEKVNEDSVIEYVEVLKYTFTKI